MNTKYKCNIVCGNCTSGCEFYDECNKEFSGNCERFNSMHDDIDTEEGKKTVLSGKDYYGGTECFDAIRKFLGEEGTKSWIIGNILKYIYRYNGKNGIEDLTKATEYLGMLIEMESKNV